MFNKVRSLTSSIIHQTGVQRLLPQRALAPVEDVEGSRRGQASVQGNVVGHEDGARQDSL